ncbi:hypothetical protein ACFLU6_13740 [Acidobacteriota bacterium]
MTRKWIFISAVLLATLSACTQEQEGERDYTPLSKGSRWEYTVKALSPVFTRYEGTAETLITGKETIQGKEYYKFVTEYEGVANLKQTVSYFRKGPDGYYRIGGKEKDKPETLMIPFPHSLGQKWIAEAPGGDMNCTLETFATVNVPGGKFKKCLGISYKGTGSLEGNIYYAPGVGRVKDAYKEIGGWEIDFRLKYYFIAK